MIKLTTYQIIESKKVISDGIFRGTLFYIQKLPVYRGRKSGLKSNAAKALFCYKQDKPLRSLQLSQGAIIISKTRLKETISK